MSLSHLKAQIIQLEEKLFVKPNDPALPLDKKRLESDLQTISESLSHLQSMRTHPMESLNLEELKAKKEALLNVR